MNTQPTMVSVPLADLLTVRGIVNEAIGKFDGALEMVMPGESAECPDEGCPHYGTDHGHDKDSVVTPPVNESNAPTGRVIPWGLQAQKSYGREFIEGVLWIESMLGLKPEFLMPCMKFESDINIRARNPMSSASGLIQFMAATARNLGTTIEAIRRMDAMTQLSYVYRYFKDFDDRGFKLEEWDLADTYMAILWPAGIGKPMSHPIFVQGKGAAYAVNKGLDANKDGFVTKGEAAARIISLAEQGYRAENRLVL